MTPTTDPNTEGAHQMGADVHRTSHAIRRALDAVIAARVSPELTGTRGIVLGFIAKRAGAGTPTYQRDIEEQFHIRRSSVTALLKAMESDGFITRTGVPADARLKSLALTDKGNACSRQLHACIAGFEQALCGGLDPPQLAALQTMLDLLRQNADALAAGQRPLP